MNVVPERRKLGLKAIRGRIAEVIFDASRGVDLRKQIAFEADSGFSIEDPLFRYFLSNVAAESLYKELGIEPETAERTSNFSYDIGFSLYGEIVHRMNSIEVDPASLQARWRAAID